MALLPESDFPARVARVDCAIQIFLRLYDLAECKPQEVMPFLVKMGLFSSDVRKGKPLRDMLRELDSRGMLHLMPGLVVDRKLKNRYWRFTMV